MKSRPLWKVSVTTSPEAEEAGEALLQTAFNLPVTSYTHFESGTTEPTVYLDREPHEDAGAEARLRTGLARIKKCGLDIGHGKISFAKVRREDWAESWKRHFHPMAIGKALLVKPSWSLRKPGKGQKVVVLDPGLSFGTGQHPTTSFCLAQLVQLRRSGERQSLLDVGTGSGILAIAAAKLRYSPVEAFDFDPEAVRVAGANARKNRVENKLHLARRDLTQLPVRSSHKYTVICANLISTLLVSSASRLLSRLQPRGALIIAGVLDREFAGVQRVYEEAGMRLTASRVGGEWRSGTFVRRQN